MRDTSTVEQVEALLFSARGLSIMGVGVGISAAANYCRQDRSMLAMMLVGADLYSCSRPTLSSPPRT
jgi:hypothetical protein